MAHITPIFQKGEPSLAKNYIPFKVYCHVFRSIQNQLLKYLGKFLSFVFLFVDTAKALFSSKIALLCLVQKWKVALNKKHLAGGILMNLPKAFETINHELSYINSLESDNQTNLQKQPRSQIAKKTEPQDHNCQKKQPPKVFLRNSTYEI